MHNFKSSYRLLVFMEACELVRLIVNKTIVPAQPKRRGNHSLENIKAVRDMGAVPVIAVNPRRKGKQCKVPNSMFFRGKRYPVEQFNGHAKHNVLRGCWTRPKGLLKKTSMVLAGLISVDANAVEALLAGDLSLKCLSKYWD